MKFKLSTQFYEILRTIKKTTGDALRRRRLSYESSSSFVSDFFASQAEYDEYREEFKGGSGESLRREALLEYQQLTQQEESGSLDEDASAAYYALIRKINPEVVVETGVCNGLSTLSILLALRENGSGVLHSVDYPYRADESLNEFRTETFAGYGGAAIPSDKDPGWIIPAELRDIWTLTIGKSQRELPLLVAELDRIDVFIHDSEHSFPCMMFEYELAYEWLSDGGVIISDDILWNDAFATFVDIRDAEWGLLAPGVGYIKK